MDGPTSRLFVVKIYLASDESELFPHPKGYILFVHEVVSVQLLIVNNGRWIELLR